jgi:hypothetical protein
LAGVIAFVGMHIGSTKVQAVEPDPNEQNLAAIGLHLAPDFINIRGQDPTLVGLGSYIVNAQADCNGCHGSDPANEYLPGHNPYDLANGPAKYNQATYLNGGQDFGPVGGGIVNGKVGPGPDIITRNLTPDYTGNPEGGNDLGKFMSIMKTGHDYDQLHLNCSSKVTDNCYFPPVDGSLLQIMPWPKFRNMTDRQLQAIWTYLSTIPCFAHDDAIGNQYPWLKNVCTKPD